MRRPAILLTIVLLGLAGCDFLQGDRVEVSGNVAATNASAGNASASASPSSAGIGSSRSLAGLSGGGDAGGGKDPQAIQAGASQGAIDPRLVGLWTDNGDCKQASELRADGSFLSASGATGRWQLEGDELVFSGEGGEARLRIESIEPDRIVTTNAEGSSGPSTRC